MQIKSENQFNNFQTKFTFVKIALTKEIFSKNNYIYNI